MRKRNIRVKKIINAIQNRIIKKKLYYIVESADWSIKTDGRNITKNMKQLSCTVSITHYGIRNAIIHFGSINTFFKDKSLNICHKSNLIVVTWFHVAPNDERLRLITDAIQYVDLWHTSCSLTKESLIKNGVPKEKIIIIPLGVDLNVFKPINKDEKIEKKVQAGIPLDYFIIGSFQKDGEGWTTGENPKYIKGPDVFCDLIEKLSKKYKIFVLLTGPARGYVINRLKKANIPYKHDYLKNPNDVSKYYQLIDLYVVSSRVEGGPKSIVESMACGVPIVSTRVGMAPDIIVDGENGFLSEIDDLNNLYENCCKVLDSKDLKNQLSKNGLISVKNYSLDFVSNSYQKLLYLPLLNYFQK